MFNIEKNISSLTGKSLKINFILPRSGLSGGIKANRLMAEALVRRGHQVRIVYISAPPPMPKFWRVRTFMRRVWNDIKNRKQVHHLMESTAELIPVKSNVILHQDVPDADVTIAVWWETVKWLNTWPENKGLKVHFIHGYELFGGDPEEVKAVYRMPVFKIVVSKWLQRIMAESMVLKMFLLYPME